MIERLEKYGEERKFLNTKTNSESDMAREDFDLEAPEEIKDVDSEDQEEIEGVLEKQEVDVVSGMKDKIEDDIVPRMQDELDDDIVKVHRLEAKIDDEYTWKQFFQENFSVERNQLSQPLYFMTLMKDADKENHQDNWILIRVHKAHWGRSPIFNWRGKSVVLDYGEEKAQTIYNVSQNPNQQSKI